MMTRKEPIILKCKIFVYSLPTEKKNTNLWGKWHMLLKREDSDSYFVLTFKQRVHYLHLVNDESSNEPYPELIFVQYL